MGIDLPRDIGTRRLTWQRARRIIENLPTDSATALHRRNFAPSLEVQFLRRIDLATRLSFWAKTKDAEKGRNAPSLVPLPGDPKDGRRDTLALDELLARRQAKRRAELARMNQQEQGASNA